MKKVIVVGLTIYATVLTVVVVNTAMSNYYLTEAVHEILEYLKQKQVDEKFALIVEDLDDFED